jgi:acetyl esterase/lipase
LAAEVSDAKAAIRWLRANAKTYSLDPEKIGVMGFGVGGEIAAILGMTGGNKELEVGKGNADQPSSVKAVVDLAGPVDSSPVNPVAYVTREAAPVLILHGTADKKVSTQQSQKLISALKVAGVNATLDFADGSRP